MAGTVAILPTSDSLSKLSDESCLVSELMLGSRWLEDWLLDSDASGNPIEKKEELKEEQNPDLNLTTLPPLISLTLPFDDMPT